jgi:hypothetical protein
MPAVLRFAVCLLAGALAGTSSTRATDSAPPAPAPVAQSAQVILAAAATPAGLTLRLRSAQGSAPLSVTGLAVTIDGKSAAATQRPDGSWWVPWPGPGVARAGKLEVLVMHDGIRELLSAALPAAAGTAGNPASSPSMLRDHKQMAWWILNIAIVLIAVIAISRRMS